MLSKVICHLLYPYTVFTSVSSTSLVLNSPDMLVFFHLLDISSVFHKHLEMIALRLSTTFFLGPTNLSCDFKFVSYCTLTGILCPPCCLAWHLEHSGNFMLYCSLQLCVSSDESLPEGISRRYQHTHLEFI